eukprot:218312_1
MSTNEVSPKWMNLRAPTITGCMHIPFGTDKNNYIVIDRKFSEKLNCISKYNVNIDKWSKIDGLNNIQNISVKLMAVVSNIRCKETNIIFNS